MSGAGAKTISNLRDFPPLFEQHPHAAWLFDLDSLHFLAVNDATCRRFGYTRDELMTMTMLDVTPDGAEPLVRRGFERVRELVQRRKDGTRFNVEVTWGRVAWDGRTVGLALAVDVSRSSRGERMVLAQNGLLEMIARAEPLAKVLDALVLFAERELPGLIASILLLDEDGTHVRHGSAPNLPDVYNQAIDGAAIGPKAGSCGTAAYFGVPVIVADIRTDERWDGYRELALPHGLVSCWSTPIKAAAGRVLGTFALYYREPRSPTDEELGFIDIVTAVARIAIERELADRARQRAEDGLRRSEAQYRQIFENDVTGDLVSLPDGTIVEGNHAFARIFGFSSPAEARGSSDALLFPRPVVREELLGRLLDERILSSLELALRRQDGKPVHVHANVVGSFDERGALERVSWYFLDRTEQKQLEEQLRQSQKMEAVGLLAGGVAHDFNNLLTVINSYSDLIQRRLGTGQNAIAEMIAEIRSAGDRASQLTRQLLAFGRKQVLAPVSLDLNGLVGGVESMLRRLIGEDITVSCELGARSPTVYADRGQIEQVVLNLALNSRDAMPQGGRIAIATRDVVVDAARAALHPGVASGSYVALVVADSGHGMDAETCARIFEPFFTTKGAGKGTGLGLATVYGILRQSGGFVEVESAPGQGATFTVYLPRDPGQTPRRARQSTQGHVVRGVETVLLVEDEDSIRALCRQVLVEQGYRVIEARHGEEALARTTGQLDGIDLLITDVVMPQMGGRALADRVQGERPGIKVLYISGYTDDDIVRHGVSEDSVSFLPKPFTPQMLLRRVREVLDQE